MLALASCLSLLPIAALADGAKTATPCGETAKECQKKVDEVEKSLKDLTAAFQAIRQQRDAALSGKSDAELQAFLASPAK